MRSAWVIAVSESATKALVVVSLVILGAGCPGSNGSSSSGTGNGTASEKGACAPVADHVRSLYKAEADATADSVDSPETRADIVEANVHMVLSDCETSPASFMGCIKKAGSVADLEKRCIIPLDDEGSVEGSQFR